MRENGPSKVKMKAIDPQKILAPHKIQKGPRAYESLNPALLAILMVNGIRHEIQIENSSHW